MKPPRTSFRSRRRSRLGHVIQPLDRARATLPVAAGSDAARSDAIEKYLWRPRSAPSQHRMVSPPSAYWRILREDEFDDAHRAEVSTFLNNEAPCGSPDWQKAIAGDAAAAIAIALQHPLDGFPNEQTDMAMTAVLYCALNGDAAAAVMIADVVRSIPNGRLSARIRTSWLAANIMRAAEARFERITR